MGVDKSDTGTTQGLGVLGTCIFLLTKKLLTQNSCKQYRVFIDLVFRYNSPAVNSFWDFHHSLGSVTDHFLISSILFYIDVFGITLPSGTHGPYLVLVNPPTTSLYLTHPRTSGTLLKPGKETHFNLSRLTLPPTRLSLNTS